MVLGDSGDKLLELVIEAETMASISNPDLKTLGLSLE